jgi:hypothetical protein
LHVRRILTACSAAIADASTVYFQYLSSRPHGIDQYRICLLFSKVCPRLQCRTARSRRLATARLTLTKALLMTPSASLINAVAAVSRVIAASVEQGRTGDHPQQPHRTRTPPVHPRR